MSWMTDNHFDKPLASKISGLDSGPASNSFLKSNWYNYRAFLAVALSFYNELSKELKANVCEKEPN